MRHHDIVDHAAPGQLFGLDWRRAADGVVLPLVLARFDIAAFAVERFAEAGLACPAQIARSVRKRQAEYFHGRLCARQALGALAVTAASGATAAPAATAAGLEGGPAGGHTGGHKGEVGIGAQREPLWPAGALGSISHSKSLAVAVVAEATRYGGIGLDIEEWADGAAAEALQGLAVSAREMDYLRRFEHSWARERLLTLVFSAKESFYKGAFGVVGRFFDFTAIELELLDLDAGIARFVLAETLSPQFQLGHSVTVECRTLGATHVASLFVW
ncbi:4'-phosphopantetheinyl transferase [Rugamonas sp. CCM 8940]|uniref:4'-phosphopantetheinyl transferase family protein n=1 Tax=Rugamonas sp. CCM 8940 TaxID=2765359 RepID=UPI0018F312D2|nr:4'-phosphopantetheinyl transferase superfamily protein [Rugamonas sp. CCM 8940]MBJ7312274.1 4'-phosphopantetheinyl transferase superfamily protein [Rugamonas sp. CCM 8940]